MHQSFIEKKKEKKQTNSCGGYKATKSVKEKEQEVIPPFNKTSAIITLHLSGLKRPQTKKDGKITTITKQKILKNIHKATKLKSRCTGVLKITHKKTIPSMNVKIP